MRSEAVDPMREADDGSCGFSPTLFLALGAALRAGSIAAIAVFQTVEATIGGLLKGLVAHSLVGSTGLLATRLQRVAPQAIAARFARRFRA